MSRASLRQDQKGIVSFFVVMIIMIVLTLIVLAFAQLVRREQRQTLDQQLKTQAQYAAESGVNDALDWLGDPANQTKLFTWNKECTGAGSFAAVAGLNQDLDPAGVISYSCLLVDPAPAQLKKTAATDSSVSFKLQPQSGTIGQLRVSWQDHAGGADVTCTNGVGSYPGNGNQNCAIGDLRLEIVPFDSPTSRDQLTDNRYIAYAQPGGLGLADWGAGTGRGQGQSVGATCAAGICRLTIGNVPNIGLGYMHVSAIYASSDVTVEAFAGGGSPLPMVGDQVEIDSTGKANDVLHRIKVDAPINTKGNGPAPEYVLQSRLTQCKRFQIPAGTPVWFTGEADFPRCDPLQAAGGAN